MYLKFNCTCTCVTSTHQIDKTLCSQYSISKNYQRDAQSHKWENENLETKNSIKAKMEKGHVWLLKTNRNTKKINKADIYLYIIKPINARISENTRHIHMVYIHTYTYTQVSISAWLLYVNSLSCRFLPLYTPCDTSINANWIKFVEHGKKKKTHA